MFVFVVVVVGFNACLSVEDQGSNVVADLRVLQGRKAVVDMTRESNTNGVGGAARRI